MHFPFLITGGRIMEPVTNITIPEMRERTHPNKHTVYIISVKGPVRSWNVIHRYSEFDSLHKELTLLRETPEPLPKKSLMKFNSEMLEERRKGLERYLQALLVSRDKVWRTSKAWCDFLQIPVVSNDVQYQPAKSIDPSLWTQELDSLVSFLSEIRSFLNDRDKLVQKGDTTQAQASKFQARKGIRLALETHDRLLDSLSANSSLSAGEVQRRKDLLLNIRNQLTEMDRSSQQASSSAQQSSRARTELLGTSPGTGRTTRKFGVALETEQTRVLDNQGLLQLQQQQLQSQDHMLDSLVDVVRRQKEIGLTISNELEIQNQLLNQVNDQVDRVESNMNSGEKKMRKIMKG
jgi:regulator of vacuolar morphogenesis